MTQQELELKLNSFEINSATNEQLFEEYGLAIARINMLAQLADNIHNHTLNRCYGFVTDEVRDTLYKLSELVTTTRLAYTRHSMKLSEAILDRLPKPMIDYIQQ